MSSSAGLIIVTPMLLDLAARIGVDPVHLGVFLCINLLIGITTPPVGMVLFTVAEVANIKVEEVIRSIIPFYLPLVAALMIITYFPQIVMFLKNK